MTRRGASATRRGFLALAGSAAFAGCNGVRRDLFGGDERTRTLDGSKLREMANRPVPTVPPVVPVEIEPPYLDAKEKRARDLLASVPDPLGRDEIPNEAIRREVTDEREAAERSLEAAASAENPLDAMADLRNARESARYVAAAWRAIDGDLTLEEAVSGVNAFRNDLDAFRAERRYVGADPIRALLVHRIVEENVARAAGYAEHVNGGRSESRPNSAPAVGEAASRLERARAALGDARYVYKRFRGSLSDPRDLRERFERVAGSLIESQRKRRDALPKVEGDDPSKLVDRNVDGTPAEELLEEFYRSVYYWKPGEEWREERLATTIVSAHERAARLRAFDAVRERISNGEDFDAEKASDVVAFREDAIAAVERALKADRVPPLTRRALDGLVWSIRDADDRLRDSDDEERAYAVGRRAVEYVRVAATARALPGASERVGSELRSA